MSNRLQHTRRGRSGCSDEQSSSGNSGRAARCLSRSLRSLVWSHLIPMLCAAVRALIVTIDHSVSTSARRCPPAFERTALSPHSAESMDGHGGRAWVKGHPRSYVGSGRISAHSKRAVCSSLSAARVALIAALDCPPLRPPVCDRPPPSAATRGRVELTAGSVAVTDSLVASRPRAASLLPRCMPSALHPCLRASVQRSGTCYAR